MGRYAGVFLALQVTSPSLPEEVLPASETMLNRAKTQYTRSVFINPSSALIHPHIYSFISFISAFGIDPSVSSLYHLELLPSIRDHNHRLFGTSSLISVPDPWQFSQASHFYSQCGGSQAISSKYHHRWSGMHVIPSPIR